MHSHECTFTEFTDVLGSESMRYKAMLRVALVGYGSIGKTLVSLIHEKGPDLGISLIGLCVRSARQDRPEGLPSNCPVTSDIGQLLALIPDVVVECAGHEALQAYGLPILNAGVDLMPVSVGAFAALADVLETAARSRGCRILVPAGAVGALDALRAAQLAGLETVCYRSRKPASAWLGSPAEEEFDLAGLDKATVLFCGTARNAALRFPKNANVAATVALATLGLDQVRVELIADPGVCNNTHEIEAIGQAGRMVLSFESKPSPDNPRTSAITAYSVLQALHRERAIIVL